MDALSISSGIAGLVALADLVFRAATRYVKSTKGAPKEAVKLLEEIKSLSVLLHDLSLVAYGLETDFTRQTPGAGTRIPSIPPVWMPQDLGRLANQTRLLDTIFAIRFVVEETRSPPEVANNHTGDDGDAANNPAA